MAKKRPTTSGKTQANHRQMTGQNTGGRPDKLTPELAQQIVLAVQGGMFPAQAAQWAGIAPSTFYLWMQKARAGETRFSEFSESIRRAEATDEFTKVAVIRSATEPKWAAWHLERRFRRRWGKNVKVEHKGAVDLNTKITGEVSPLPTPQELLQRYANLVKRFGPPKHPKSPKTPQPHKPPQPPRP